MPRLFNPQRKSEPVTLADGTTIHIRPKARIYISPGNMTGVLWGLIKARRLINRGGDPKKKTLSVHHRPVIRKLQKYEVKTDTSSVHHRSRDSVSVKSSEIVKSEKEEKVDKNQSDSINNAVIPHKGKTKTKISSVDSKQKRRRRKKKDG